MKWSHHGKRRMQGGMNEHSKATHAKDRKRRERETHATSASLSLSESTCASSLGGPGLNRGEHIAGRSRFGTVHSWVIGFEGSEQVEGKSKREEENRETYPKTPASQHPTLALRSLL